MVVKTRREVELSQQENKVSEPDGVQDEDATQVSGGLGQEATAESADMGVVLEDNNFVDCVGEEDLGSGKEVLGFDKVDSVDGPGAAQKKDKTVHPDEEMSAKDMIQCCGKGCKAWRRADQLGLTDVKFGEVEVMLVLCGKCAFQRAEETTDRIETLEKMVESLQQLVGELVEGLPGNTQKVEKQRTERREEVWPTLPERSTTNGKKKISKEKYNRTEMNKNLSENSKKVNNPRQVNGNTDMNGVLVQEPEACGGVKQTEGVEDQNMWNKVNRKRKAMKRNKIPITLVGDSMIRHVRHIVRCEGEGSACLSMAGAGIKQVMDKAIKKAEEMDEGVLVIEGGGNSLGWLDDRETAKVIIDGVQTISGRNRKLRVAVVGILPRPRESNVYEGLRLEANRKVQEEIFQMNGRHLRGKDGGRVSYLDLDPILQDWQYANDGVHLNREGVNVLGKVILKQVTDSVRAIEWEKMNE